MRRIEDEHDANDFGIHLNENISKTGACGVIFAIRAPAQMRKSICALLNISKLKMSGAISHQTTPYANLRSACRVILLASKSVRSTDNRAFFSITATHIEIARIRCELSTYSFEQIARSALTSLCKSPPLDYLIVR